MSPGNGSTIPAHSSLWQCFNEAGTHESRKWQYDPSAFQFVAMLQ